MWWLFSVVLILRLSSLTIGQSNDYDCDVPPPLGVEPLTCCRVSKPFDRINFPECFAAPAVVITSTLPPIPVTEYIEDATTLFSVRNKAISPTKGPKGDQDGKKDKHYGHLPGKWRFGHNDHKPFHGYHYTASSESRYRRQVRFRVNPQPTPLCAIECIFNQTNILANGRFDRDVALDVYADYYPEVPIDLLTRTIDRCTKQLRNYLIARRRRSRNQVNRNPTKPCRNGSGLFAACFNREVYRNCPTEIDTDSDDCQSLRTFIDNCSPIRGVRTNFSYDNVDVDENGNFIPQDG